MQGRHLEFKAKFKVIVATILLSSAANGYTLITDVDDTIKITHVNSTVNSIIHFLGEGKAFAGMSVLYTRLLQFQQKTSPLIPANFKVYSGAPSIVGATIKDFLSDFLFPVPQSISYRSLGESTYDFKLRELQALFTNYDVNKKGFVVLVGDDTEYDHLVYSKINSQFKLNARIYIHRVRNITLPAGEVAYDTSLDIAALEAAEGRLSTQDFEAILPEFEYLTSNETVIVPEEYCPKMNSPRVSQIAKVQATLGRALTARFKKVEDQIRSFCP